MITFEEGLIITCLFPLFSALNMLLRASLSTLILTILQKTSEAGIQNNKSRLNQSNSVIISIENRRVLIPTLDQIQQQEPNHKRRKQKELKARFR